MKKSIELESSDWSQIMSAMEIRAESWENTAAYMSGEELDDPTIIVEECRDANEANSIAAHYRALISSISQQLEKA